MSDPTASAPKFEHESVLLEEALDALAIRPDGRYVDGTAGGGGHSFAILERSAPDGRLLALDVDPAAIAATQRRLAPFGDRVTIVQSNFDRLAEVAGREGFVPSDGVLLDLGVSSYQLADPTRGFSFAAGGPLDMRMAGAGGITAGEVVNYAEERELADIIYKFGEDRQSRRIARAIVAARPIDTAERLADVVARAIGRRQERIHPATRTFQALRIAVNRELDVLTSVLQQAFDVLRIGGRMVVITFHSLEDRIVKTFLREAARGCTCPPRLPQCVCGRQPLLVERPRGITVPSDDEIRRNPRARSAKLRTAEKLTEVGASR